MKVRHAIIGALEALPDDDRALLGTASRSTAEADLIRLKAHTEITMVPMKPAIGSSRGRPK